jgi:hypothetical protein
MQSPDKNNLHSLLNSALQSRRSSIAGANDNEASPPRDAAQQIGELRLQLERLRIENEQLRRHGQTLTSESGAMVLHTHQQQQRQNSMSMRELMRSTLRLFMGDHDLRHVLFGFLHAAAPHPLRVVTPPLAPPPPPALTITAGSTSLKESIAAGKKAKLEAAKALVAKNLFEKLTTKAERTNLEAAHAGEPVLQASVTKKQMTAKLGAEELDESQIIERMAARFKSVTQEKIASLDSTLVDSILDKMFKNNMLNREGYESPSAEEKLTKAIADVRAIKKGIFSDAVDKLASHATGNAIMDKIDILRGEVWDIYSMASNTKGTHETGAYNKGIVQQVTSFIDKEKKDHSRELQSLLEQFNYKEDRVKKICKSRIDAIKKEIGKNSTITHMSPVAKTLEAEPAVASVTTNDAVPSLPVAQSVTTTSQPQTETAVVTGAGTAASGWFSWLGWSSKPSKGAADQQGHAK